jgi:NADH-quinone oxidoreductase subunit H
MIVTSAVAVTLFLGGWYFPWLDSIKNQTVFVLASVVVFAAKVFGLIYAYMWFRWTWPRYRYDQLMELGWKWMIPAGLANIVLTGIWYVIALPKGKGGLFNNLMTTTTELSRLVPTTAGKAYFIVTGFAITIPIVWSLLAAINRRSRDFNLHEQRQLQIQLRRERLDKRPEPQPAE